MQKAIVLLSGGLDSALAARLVMDQGIEVHGLNFHSPFCTCASQNRSQQGCGAARFAAKLGIQIEFLHKGDEYLEIVKHPRFGRGRYMNPCIDCRIHVMRSAKAVMEREGASFIVTGEVLDQRPMSQHARAMALIEREAGLDGLVLRPLSAALLPPTIPEREGIIDRGRLLAVRGRSRNVQLTLARDFQLVDQYCAGGGCRLTCKEHAAKVRDYMAHADTPRMDDMKWLAVGRHYRTGQTKIICGRNEAENDLIKAWATPGDAIVELVDVPGPSVIVFPPHDNDAMTLAATIAMHHAGDVAPSTPVRVVHGPAALLNRLLASTTMEVARAAIHW